MTAFRLKPHPIPDAALDADIAILGKKGRGKTFTAKGIVERLLQMQRRVLVLDPLSVWWGLKYGADGRETPRFSDPRLGRATSGYSVARRRRVHHCRTHCLDRHIRCARHGPN